MKPQGGKRTKFLKPLLTILVGIVLIAGTGLGVWWWQNGEIQKQRIDSNKNISDLQKQVNNLKEKQATSQDRFPAQPTTKEIEDAAKLPKDKCGCWDDIRKVCTPVADCI